MRSINLAKIILIIVIFSTVLGMFYFVFNENDIKKQENELLTREENIKRMNEVYSDKFKTIGKTDSAFIFEHGINNNGIEIRKDYYIFGEGGKSLIKIKEYEGIYENGTPILKKEIYIDLTKKVEGTEKLYNEVTIINVEDWSCEILDNYEFETPIEKITKLLNKRYDFEKDYKKIALDKRNELYFNNWPELNHRLYGWNYEIKENNLAEYLSFNISNEERYLYFNFEVYEDNKRTEKISMQVSKQKGSLDDVTVPEL